MDLAAGVYLSEAPSPPNFLLGVVKQFYRFAIWSNTPGIIPIYALHTTDPPPTWYTHYKYIPLLYLFT
jgi:hypothetical protein